MSANERGWRLYRYVIDHDKGFAPNPFFGVCTLACCKPKIRKHAAAGDVIVGFGPAKYDLDGRIIYWMHVDEVIDFDSYWHDARFRIKRPGMGGSLCLCYGDNIYHRCPETGGWIQEASFHSDPSSLSGRGNLKRDTARTDRVLIGYEYAYWGDQAVKPPDRFEPLVKRGIGEQYSVDDENLKAGFVEWLRSLPDRGFCHDPADWSHDRKLHALFEKAKQAC